MKRLTIAQIVPPDETVPPLKYGGVELVVHNLTEELVKRGHKVYLLASGNSKTKGNLVPIFPKNFRTFPEHSNREWQKKMTTIYTAKMLYNLNKLKFDIAHNHWGSAFIPFSEVINAPMVTTLHNPTGFYYPYGKMVYEKFFKKSNYISISKSQKNSIPTLHYIANIYHGLQLKKYKFSEKKDNYFAFLGKIWPQKGIKEAIIASKKSGVNLKIAAKIEDDDMDYFQKEINPLIDGKQIEYLGEVSFSNKIDFLKRATGLISPIQWEEPFGMIFIEAMASGTPVIAFARGSVPEIIQDGKNGFVVKGNNLEAMVEAIKKVHSMPPDEYRKMSFACRKRVENNFTAEKMTDEYEKAYEKILERI